MSKSMRVYHFLQSNFFCEGFDNQKHHYTRKLTTPAIEKCIIFKTFLNGNVHTDFFHIDFQIFHRVSADRYQTFFVSFTQHAEKSDVKINIRQTKVYQFAYTKS